MFRWGRRLEFNLERSASLSLGAVYNGGMAMNKDSFAKLPPEIQAIVREVGLLYSKTLGETLMQRYEGALKTMAQTGARQNPPVTITPLPAAEREKWVRTLPNLAGDWAKSNASRGPAAEVVRTYMDALRARGVKSAREWDREL